MRERGIAYALWPTGTSHQRPLQLAGHFVCPMHLLLLVKRRLLSSAYILLVVSFFLLKNSVKEFVGWNLAFISPLLPAVPDHMALNAKVVGTNRVDQMVAIATGVYKNIYFCRSSFVSDRLGSKIRLWSCSLGSHSEIGTTRAVHLSKFSILFIKASKDMSIRVDALFFIGSQLVAISKSGKVVVWHAMTHQWQVRMEGRNEKKSI